MRSTMHMNKAIRLVLERCTLYRQRSSCRQSTPKQRLCPRSGARNDKQLRKSKSWLDAARTLNGRRSLCSRCPPRQLFTKLASVFGAEEKSIALLRTLTEHQAATNKGSSLAFCNFRPSRAALSNTACGASRYANNSDLSGPKRPKKT